MQKEQRENLEEIHVMPTKDCIEHTESMECLCSPKLDGRNQWDIKEGRSDKVVVIHTLIWTERQ